MREWRKTPKAQEYKLKRKNSDKFKEYRRQYRKEYKRKNPWFKHYKNICVRITRQESYRKIKNYLTIAQLKGIWFRDKAWLFKRPSIHRIDNSKDYTILNCCFIELTDNVRKKFGRWAVHYDCCQGCKTTDRPHNAKGLCAPCYGKKKHGG